MIVSIWRYSHVTLAISSFLFVFIAAITGVILALEPIQEQIHPYKYDLENITVNKLIGKLKDNYDEIISIEKDHNSFVIASVITEKGKNQQFYINPNTGEKVGELLEKKPFFQLVTNIHRSLFLKSTGRALVGIASFLLLLIAITGSILIVKRQGGIRFVFSKVVKESNPQYYHVILGRIAFIPILIITITGVYLSLEKFNLIPKNKTENVSNEIKNEIKKPVDEFAIFNDIFLTDFKRLEFPFSEFDDDYFYLKTATKEFQIHQYSGETIEETTFSWQSTVANFSLILHTGQGSITWSIILLLASASIIYFIYSGFAIALEKQRKKATKPSNTITANEAEIIVLVGSETGSTYKPAKALFDGINKTGKKVFIDDLNAVVAYKNARTILILTSTYGKGEAPKNADQFINKIQKIQFKNPIQFAVVGFGSLAYPDYCEFAIQIDKLLTEKEKMKSLLPLEKIHNQSLLSFKNWIDKLSEKLDHKLKIDESLWKIKHKNLDHFTVIDKTVLNVDQTFLITLKPKKNTNFQSGDLLVFYPEDEVSPRYYSIAKLKDNILLSIKKHKLGKASTYFANLEIGEIINAKIDKNPMFHQPKHKPLLYIANGTGIAPFLGMLKPNKLGTHLFWGGRTSASFELYKSKIENAITEQRLQNFELALSREGHKKYVQDSILENESLVLKILENNGLIMICGSLQMEKAVRKILKEIALKNYLSTENMDTQILSDCY